MTAFKAYLIEQGEGGRSAGRMTTLDEAALDAGEVTLRVHFSSINYKDALAATGAGRVVRRFPCVGGIDLAGVVTSSTEARFAPGDEVLATSFDLGVSHHGGYAEVARVPAAWVVPLPAGLDLHAVMALGTAGFTAALAITRMEHEGLAPGRGPVVVTGASGGVGCLAVEMLAGLGHEVVALTGKPEEAGLLRRLGAARVLLRSEVDFAATRPLEAGQWAGAIDNVGGAVLHWLLATMKQAGTVASVGNAASAKLETTVFPFILRGASLLGVDSGYVGFPMRGGVWQRLATELRPRHLAELTRTIDFDALPGAFADFVAGRARGRTVVRIGG